MTILLFLYFFTLHADLLGAVFSFGNVRVNNLFALFVWLLLGFKGYLSVISLDRNLIKILCFIVLSLLVSLIASFDFLRSSIFAGWLSFTLISYLILPLILMDIWEKKVIKIYLLSFLCVGIYALGQFSASLFGVIDPFAKQFLNKQALVRPNAFAFEPSYYALYMTPFVVMTNTSFLLRRISIWVMLIINFLYLISASAAVFFAYFIFTIVIFISSFIPWIRGHYATLRRRIIKAYLVSIAFFLCLLMIAPTFSEKFFLKFFFKGLAHPSFQERWYGILVSWEIFKEHPFFGIGLGSIPSYALNQWQQGELSLLVYPDFFFIENALKLFEPTNVLMEMMSSVGLFGLTSFIFLGYYYVKCAKKAIQSAHCENERDLSFAFLISMIVTVIVWQFNQGLMRSYIWVHFALGLSYFIRRSHHRTKECT